MARGVLFTVVSDDRPAVGVDNASPEEDRWEEKERDGIMAGFEVSMVAARVRLGVNDIEETELRLAEELRLALLLRLLGFVAILKGLDTVLVALEGVAAFSFNVRRGVLAVADGGFISFTEERVLTTLDGSVAGLTLDILQGVLFTVDGGFISFRKLGFRYGFAEGRFLLGLALRGNANSPKLGLLTVFFFIDCLSTVGF